MKAGGISIHVFDISRGMAIAYAVLQRWHLGAS
jgi:hypothetical protein